MPITVNPSTTSPIGLSYDPTQKLWSFNPEPTRPLLSDTPPNTTYYINAVYTGTATVGANVAPVLTKFEISPTSIGNSTNTVFSGAGRGQTYTLTTTKSGPISASGPEGFPSFRDKINGDVQNVLGGPIPAWNPRLGGPNVGQVLSDWNNTVMGAGGIYEQLQTAQNNAQINQTVIRPFNDQVAANNKGYNDAIAIIGTAQGGDYVAVRDKLRALNLSPAITSALENGFKAFYRTEKLQTWNPALGANPPYGAFDAAYYKQQNPALAQQWATAVANDDIDITERYGENGFYLQHYTTQGKPAGLRGNAAEVTQAANAYLEKKPTDIDLQNVRNLQLGVDTATQTTRLLAIPEIAAEWEKAKQNDPYWNQLAKTNYLDVTKPDDFAALFRLSNRPEDKQISLNYNINAGYGITELEDALNAAVGTKATVDVKKFGALAQDVLKQTIEEMKKAKSKESMLSLLNGFGGFGEIVDINKTLSNSILGDTGVGGVLSFTSKGNPQDVLEKSLQNITGVNNNVAYNWQQWFDNTLKQRYQQDLELGLTQDQASEKVAIEGAFAREFIDKYLLPRFNTSRSMDEFVEYLDVRQEEQNPFQTQDMLNAVKLVADLRSTQYLDQLKLATDRAFDPVFYFNPTGDQAREALYQEQAATVAQDWAAAKAGDPYWQQQAYRFGVNVDDKAAFARLHFQVKGQGKGYDAAEDILNASKVSNEIYNNIFPALQSEALKQGTVFGIFTTPEEFATELLKGIDPNNPTQWNDVLKRYGLSDFKGSIDELKEYLVQALRTGSAQRIREEIKYLNEQREKPTQQNLGITYIQRPEDYKTVSTQGDTQLYKIFQSAGYQGTEDEFYTKLFPDIDRSEQQLLTKAGANSGLQFNTLDLKDPFASLGTIESFFETPQDTTTAKTTDSTSNYFKLDLGTAPDTTYKSATGQKILGEFTSMFKGF